MNKRRVVITGLGTINPAGNDVNTSWERVKAGETAVAPITAYDASENKVTLAAEVKDFDPKETIPRTEAKHMARFTQFALVAAKEAMESAGFVGENAIPDAERFGVIVSSGIGGIDIIEREHDRGNKRGFEMVNPFFIPMAISNMAAARIAITYGLKGMCTTPVTACAGGSNAIGDAFHRVRDGYEDVMIAGGCEASITPLSMGGFASMKALCTATDPKRASIPFDADRCGFVMGEGSGLLVMEELEHAKARNARIYGEIVGYGANCDAYHITAPVPGGTGGAECMKIAIADADMQPSDINYINAHGTSTHLNDAGETAAIHTVFGDDAANVPVSSTKSVTGHLLGAAGGVEAVFCVKALEEGVIPPTAGLINKDPECDLDYVPNTARKADIRTALSNSLGFGGHNACLIFRKYEEA